MSIINITIDTSKGDTLQDALQALMTSNRLEFPRYPEPKSVVDPNPFGYAESDKITTASNGGTVSAKITVDQNVSTINAQVGYVSASTMFNEGDVAKSMPTATLALSAMDGDRKRGEPGAGHRRRTNAQIAEDEAWFKQRGHAAVATMDLGTEAPETRAQTADPSSPKSDSATTQPSQEFISESLISSGAARGNPEDDAQDAADEAAESASHRRSEATLDDLRKVIGEYQKKFGMAQAAAKTLEYTGYPIFEVPSKDIPLVIARWQAAIEHDKPNDAKFTPIKTESGVVQGTPAPATREQVNAAINDYATKFDGSLNPVEMVITKTDIPRLMERLFGAGKNNFNAIERTPDNYGRVIAAIRAEIGKNTFGRVSK